VEAHGALEQIDRLRALAALLLRPRGQRGREVPPDRLRVGAEAQRLVEGPRRLEGTVAFEVREPFLVQRDRGGRLRRDAAREEEKQTGCRL
jgi:hypothetical protein